MTEQLTPAPDLPDLPPPPDAEFWVFCDGVPTDVVDTSALTTASYAWTGPPPSGATADRFAVDPAPCELMPRLAGEGPHPLAATISSVPPSA